MVANGGPDPATAVTLVDTFPADLSCTWAGVAAGGATGNTDGSGDIAETLDLPSGSSVTYTVPCIIDPAATGTLSNTAVVTAAGIVDATTADHSATDDDTVLTPRANLAVAMTDDACTLLPSDSLTYVVEVTNVGPSDAVDAQVTDLLPAELASCQWTCVANGAATCTAGPVAGDLSDLADIPVGDQVTYTGSCTAESSGFESVVNTVTVELPLGTTDPAPGNNVAISTVAGSLAIFADCFESGDPSGWSAAVP